ncbi:MAG: hypothetical protein Q9176_002629 [Flavoplaca citrina]
MGGSANGDLPEVLGSMGELTEVASAKRAVRGVFNDSPEEELEDVRDRTSTRESFSSPLTDWVLSELCKIGAFDMLATGPSKSAALVEFDVARPLPPGEVVLRLKRKANSKDKLNEKREETT